MQVELKTKNITLHGFVDTVAPHSIGFLSQYVPWVLSNVTGSNVTSFDENTMTSAGFKKYMKIKDTK